MALLNDLPCIEDDEFGRCMFHSHLDYCVEFSKGPLARNSNTCMCWTYHVFTDDTVNTFAAAAVAQIGESAAG